MKPSKSMPRIFFVARGAVAVAVAAALTIGCSSCAQHSSPSAPATQLGSSQEQNSAAAGYEAVKAAAKTKTAGAAKSAP